MLLVAIVAFNCFCFRSSCSRALATVFMCENRQTRARLPTVGLGIKPLEFRKRAIFSIAEYSKGFRRNCTNVFGGFSVLGLMHTF